MPTKFIQLPPCLLESFINSSATSFDVAGFLYNDGVTPVDPDDIGDICYATLEPRTEREELISFTIDSVTSGGVATITAVRGLSQKSPYGTGGASFDHQSGTNLVISNNPGLFNKLPAKANDEDITGAWTFPDPVANQNPVTKKHFDDNAVKLTGDQTVAGEKTFSTSPKIPDSSDVDEALTKGESNTIEATNVKLTGDQTVAGEKTFSTSPKVPDATADDEPYTKGQHDADAVASSAVASPTVRGSAKLDTAADTPLDPEVLTATADRVAAMAGGGPQGTPSASNKFQTEEGSRLIDGFGDGSDGDVTISTPTTLTRDMHYENLVVNDTLTTDGYVIYVRNKISGSGTIRHSVPNTGLDATETHGTGSSECSGGGGGGGAASGNVVILATNVEGTFTIEAIGDDGGNASRGTTSADGGNSQTGGIGGTERGSGPYVGKAGGAGGDGQSGDNDDEAGVAGTSASNLSQVSNGKGGGNGGGDAGGTGGGSGGSGGSSTAPARNITDHRFLAESLLALDSSLALKTFYENPGSGGGGSGYCEQGDNDFGGGAGGAGGNGGDAILIYKNKTWTGTADLSGGAAGAGAAGASGGQSGGSGNAGDDGELIEVDYTVIK